MANPGQITDDDIVKDAETRLGSGLPDDITKSILASGNFKVAQAIKDTAPNRSRRAWFVGGSWTASFVATVGLAAHGGDGAIAKAAVDGFTSYMMAVATMYLLGHSIDRTDFFNKVRGMLPGGQPPGGQG